MADLSGMTGFGASSGEADWGTWRWEAKSVNGRGLDLRVNVPPGFEALERAAKAGAATIFKRGNMQLSLKIELNDGGAAIAVNEAALASLITAHTKANGGNVPSGEAVAALMGLKGVIETGGASTRDLAAVDGVLPVLEAGLSELLSTLAASRRSEGESLTVIFNTLIAEMDTLVAFATSIAAEHPALIKTRLEKQLAELKAETQIDADRMAAEVALSAAKADIREELDRLDAHLETARAHLAAGSPIGRKLDFLAQELNREANTLCSKSASLDLTNAGLGLKSLIDQFKEQAANVE